MNEIQEALSLIHDLINAGGKDFAAWRLYRLERLMHNMRERYFFAPDDVAVLGDDIDEEELVELTENPTYPAA